MLGHKLAIAIVGGIALMASMSAQRLNGPKLGRAATEDEIKVVDLSIPPDGTGLPAGRGLIR